MTSTSHAPARGRALDAERPVRRPLALGALVVAVVAHVWLQAGPLIAAHGWGRRAVRDYFPFDQYAYLAIARNAAEGRLEAAEPFTGTGSNHYPRLYYQALGTVAGWLGVDVATAWNVVGLAIQALLVAGIGLAAILLTRRWWAGLLGFVPFALGSFAWTEGGGTWLTQLDSHAVLWGTYGTMATLNGETVALAVAGLGSLALVLLAAGRWRPRGPWWWASGICAVLGLLASVHTYTFLGVALLLAYAAGAAGLIRSGSAVGWVLSAAALTALVALGPSLQTLTGPLAVLAAAMVPALPGVVLLARETRGRALWPAALFGAGAAPQLLGTALGVRQGDPFLLYREASSEDLGVPWDLALRSGLVVVLLLVTTMVFGLLARVRLAVAIPAGGLVVWMLVTTNDRWGANQEPYRFFLNLAIQLAVLGVPLAAWALVRARESGGPVLRWSALLASLGLLSAAVLAGPDVDTFRSALAAKGYNYVPTPQRLAAVEAIDGVWEDGDGPVLPDPCIDPLAFKTVWGGPVAYYNLGLAWPEREAALREVLEERKDHELDLEAARAAGVSWVLVDTACWVDWRAVAGEAASRGTAYRDGEERGEVVAVRIGR